MKLTCVTAVFNAIKSGNRENLIRCVRSVAALKTPHEHLIYDGASTDGTVELLRELEEKIGVENRCTADGLGFPSDAARTPRLRVVSEPDTGIFNALNKGVRNAQGEWFYVLGADDYICNPDVMDRLIADASATVDIYVSTVERDQGARFFTSLDSLRGIMNWGVYSHQGVLMRTAIVRQYGGFDERFKVSADYDMLLKAHQEGLCFNYRFEPYAFYATGGISDSTSEAVESVEATLAERFGFSARQLRNRSKWSYPLWKLLPYLSHRDYALRTAARTMARKRIWAVCRLPLLPLIVATRPIRLRNRRKVVSHG